MDGTLWDSAAEVAESWNETVKRAGYDRKPITVKDIQSVMGKTMDVIARILFPDLEEGERQKLLHMADALSKRVVAGSFYGLIPGLCHSVGKKKMIISGYTEQLSTRISAGQWNS